MNRGAKYSNRGIKLRSKKLSDGRYPVPKISPQKKQQDEELAIF